MIGSQIEIDIVTLNWFPLKYASKFKTFLQQIAGNLVSIIIWTVKTTLLVTNSSVQVILCKGSSIKKKESR